MKKLPQSQVTARLEHLDGWEGGEEGEMMQKQFRFENFSDAMVFVNCVAEEAEEANHHPDICISYNSVVIMLTTHDVQGLSERDFKMAKSIDEIIK